ncbi:MAG: glycyl-tRNA synthetase beta chain [Acidobacteriota bacterium]|jgi:glycyl-tRNA synthetase beta chain|nr:glycyl-tRNA synthetase beta chain [Acidobacteriota bacterium]
MSEYFFELLTEEIPASMLDAALASIHTSLEKTILEMGASTPAAGIKVTATPRRILFFLSNLPEKQADHVDTVKGPPKKAAYDADGKPTKALEGFLKKNNASIDDVLTDGDYIQVKRNVTGRAAKEILAERVPQIIEGLRWPKMMRWGAGEYSYIRPIHSVISVFDSAHLPIRIFGVESGTKTVGHRTLAPDWINVTSYGEYQTKLELARVVIDVVRRRHVMAERALVLAKQVQGTPSDDATIWAQWQYLTEYPGLVRAEFRDDYLALPEEVLVTVMRVHQKQLPIRDANGRLSNSFIAVLDNEADPDGNAAYGNSFVTNARFADAKFFYDVDRKTPLAERIDQLSHLQFHEKLGNYADKTRRIETIARAICADLGTYDADAVTAAHLCKSDLVTEMVKEFTELQGKVGGIYAREEKLSDGVWQAIYDHYLPVNLDDALPRALSGAVVSLADKIDTLVGFFRIGAKPTGSKDPFALRRAAQGVVQILLNRDKREVKIGIERLIDLGMLAHDQPANGALKADLLAFFAERVRTLLETSAYNFAYDEVAATMEGGWASSLTDLVNRTDAIKVMRDQPNFLKILDSAKRIANITAGHDSTTVDRSKLEHDSERRLNELADTVGEQISELIAARHYLDALRSFAALAPELESFFDDVMVNVEDEAVRRNRMSLLRKVGNSVSSIADVTKIVVDRREYRE